MPASIDILPSENSAPTRAARKPQAPSSSEALAAFPDAMKDVESEAAAGKVPVSPDKAVASPDKAVASPDKAVASPDQVAASPDQVPASADKLPASPGGSPADFTIRHLGPCDFRGIVAGTVCRNTRNRRCGRSRHTF